MTMDFDGAESKSTAKLANAPLHHRPDPDLVVFNYIKLPQ
jgi:hypothetical protein